MTAHRFHEVRQTAASIEWYELPIVGEEPRHVGRARALRQLGLALLVFWAGVAVTLVCML
jgi:hypothetical protein